MQWHDYLKFIAAFVFVLALMGGLSMLLKRLGYGTPGVVASSKRRLKIIEILPLDARRKAVLLRRDDTEHLVIFGPTGETVVEANILPSRNDEHDRDDPTDKTA